ncbi:hypothetical protein C8R46DRAFT_1107939 [Mycena filopes]|nr:hypothetical protein C8R46DRAFT_1107939 [Mycena filopes]
MSLPGTTLLSLVLASLLPLEASAVIIVYHDGHNGLSDSARIAIIVVAIVLFLALLTCRLLRIRQNRRALAAARATLPAPAMSTTQVPAANYAGQGPGGFNGYTLPPTQQQQQQYGQSGYPQQQAQQQVYPPPGYGGQDVEKGYNDQAPSMPMGPGDMNAAQQPQYTGGGYAPPPGPPNGGYYPPPVSPPPAAHTTDHSAVPHTQ